MWERASKKPAPGGLSEAFRLRQHGLLSGSSGTEVMDFALLNQQRHSNIDWSHAIRRPTKSEITNRTRNTPNRTLAITAAVPAMLEKPSSAATKAMIKKKIDQDKMGSSFLPITIYRERLWFNS